MIFVAGTLTIDPAACDSFARDMAAIVDQVRAEAGCHHYSLLVENAGTGLVNVLEQWTDDAALLAHFAEPWTAEFFRRQGPNIRVSDVRIFDIAGERPMLTIPS